MRIAMYVWVVGVFGVSAAVAGGSIVGVNFGGVGGSPVGWTNLTGLPTQYEAGLVDEMGNATGVAFSASSPVSAGQTQGSSFDPGFIPTHTVDVSALRGYMWGVDTYNMRFDNLEAGAAYEVFVVTSRAGTSFGNLVTISGHDDEADVVFTQTGGANEVAVNGEAGDPMRMLGSYAVRQRADALGKLYIRINDHPDVNFGVWSVSAVGVRMVPAPGAVVVLGVGCLGVCRRR